MEADELYQWMERPAGMPEEVLPDLRRLVERYPYFHVPRLLYLKRLADAGSDALPAELERMAICLPDRRRLFDLLEGERYGLSPVEPPAVEPEPSASEDSFSLIDAFLAKRGEPEGKELERGFPSVSNDYLGWSLSGDEKKAPDTEEAPGGSQPLRHQELIDSFIRNERHRLPGEGLAGREEAETPESVRELEGDHARLLEDSCLTETLARIYIKQKRYDKALQIIKNLRLKYPEKNVYFADQIRFLEKLIINTKK